MVFARASISPDHIILGLSFPPSHSKSIMFNCLTVFNFPPPPWLGANLTDMGFKTYSSSRSIPSISLSSVDRHSCLIGSCRASGLQYALHHLHGQLGQGGPNSSFRCLFSNTQTVTFQVLTSIGTKDGHQCFGQKFAVLFQTLQGMDDAGSALALTPTLLQTLHLGKATRESLARSSSFPAGSIESSPQNRI